MELSSRFGTVAGSKGGAGDINLYGIIKEVDADPEGVVEFQTKYFNLNELYLDKDRHFYKSFGYKSLLAQPLHSWNPFTLYKDFKKLMGRMKEKNIEGNLIGEGKIKGGLYVISPKDGVVYAHDELTGTEMPYAEIETVVAKLLGREASAESNGGGFKTGADGVSGMHSTSPGGVKTEPSDDMAVCMSRETCGDD